MNEQPTSRDPLEDPRLASAVFFPRPGQPRGNIILAQETDDLPFPNELQGIGCLDGPLVH